MKERSKHIFLLLAVGIGLSILFWSGPNLTFDDALYIKYGAQLLMGTFKLQTPYAYGILFIYSQAIGQFIFGSLGGSLIQMMEYLSIPLICYCIGYKYFSAKISLAVSLSLEISMFILGYSSRVLPDMLSGVLIGLVFLILAYKREDNRYMLICGFLTAATAMVKMGGFVLLFLLGLYTFPLLVGIGSIAITLILIWRFKGRAFFIAGFFLSILLFEIIIGSPLLILAQNYSTNQVALSNATLGLNIETMLINLVAYNQMALQYFPIGALLIFGIIGTVIMVWKRERELYFVGISFWTVFFYLYLGTQSFHSYAFITVESRYFIELAVPMALLAGVFLDWIAKKVGENKVLFYAVLITVASNIPMYIMFFNNRLPVFVL